MDEQLKNNLTSTQSWLRLLYMAITVLCLYIAAIVTSVVVILQFLFTVVTGSENFELKRLGGGLSQFFSQSLLYLTYNSHEKPFPFSDWPSYEIEESEQEESLDSEPEVIEKSADVESEAEASAEDAIAEAEEVLQAEEVEEEKPKNAKSGESKKDKEAPVA